MAGLWLGLFSAHGRSGETSSTSLTRVGFALQDPSPERNGPADWAALGADVDYVRAPLNKQTHGVFDLVVAVRGLDNGGAPNWAKAEQLCRSLSWPVCDRAALERLRERSRP
ncbi:MAG TPA: hypothetical protein VHU40_21830 [Polyangia bacterium]|nr:hypothetical protein [Polyangia bacterium]